MGLIEHEVTGGFRGTCAKEMIETDLKEFRRGRVACDMPAELAVILICPHHHRQRVPADEGRDSLLERKVTGVGALPVECDCVAVSRIGLNRGADSLAP